MTTLSNSIMLVDDERDIVSIFSRGLEEIGLKVYSFTEPARALSFFKSNAQEIGLIISDIRMPGVTGFELAVQARAIKPDVKILLMSAYEIAKASYADERFSLRVDEFLQKPIFLSQLCSIVVKHLQRAEHPPLKPGFNP